jgi:hypothetical protein
LEKSGFQEVGVEGLWRDNALNLVGCRALARWAKAGERIVIPKGEGDYVVLIRPGGKR